MAAQLILIAAWAKSVFVERIPHPNTLRRWVHNGLIRPAPKRIGKSFYVDVNAVYVDPIADKIDRMTRGS